MIKAKSVRGSAFDLPKGRRADRARTPSAIQPPLEFVWLQLQTHRPAIQPSRARVDLQHAPDVEDNGLDWHATIIWQGSPSAPAPGGGNAPPYLSRIDHSGSDRRGCAGGRCRLRSIEQRDPSAPIEVWGVIKRNSSPRSADAVERWLSGASGLGLVDHRSMSECLACDLAAGRVPPPGGLILETGCWRVEYCVGPLGIGTLVVKPKRHVLHAADLGDDETLEMGPLIRRTATAVGRLTDATQVYACLWSHGPVHIHCVVQPALPDAVSEFGVYGPRIQAAMFAQGGSVDPHRAAAFAEAAESGSRATAPATDLQIDSLVSPGREQARTPVGCARRAGAPEHAGSLPMWRRQSGRSPNRESTTCGSRGIARSNTILRPGVAYPRSCCEAHRGGLPASTDRRCASANGFQDASTPSLPAGKRLAPERGTSALAGKTPMGGTGLEPATSCL